LLHAASDIFELNESIVPLVTELCEQGHRLGILSNTNESHWNFIASSRFSIVQEMFELYALSYEMRTTKPDLAAYTIAAELAGVAPKEIFFTDDRLENVEAACRAGFDATQFVGADSLHEQLLARRLKITSI
jgi:glucose-1-phosphatase